MARSDLHLGRAALSLAFRFSDVFRVEDRKERLSEVDSAMPAAFAHPPLASSNCFRIPIEATHARGILSS
jgi:hypothetical protein